MVCAACALPATAATSTATLPLVAGDSGISELVKDFRLTHLLPLRFIALERKDGVEVKYLKPGDKPEAVFSSDGAVAVYEYCNLHGLWKADL